VGRKPKQTITAAIAWLIVANVLTGVYNPLIKYSLRYMPLYNFALLRHAGPALLVLPFAIKKWKKLKRRDLLLSILCGLVMYGGANLLFYLGIERTSSINAAIILMLEPILLFVFSVELMRERFKKKVFSGIIIAFLGTALIVLGPALGKSQLSAGGLIGNLLIVGTVVCGVIGVWLMKYLSKRVPTLQLLFIGLATAAVMYFVLALPTITDMASLHNSVVFFTVIYGIVGVGAISYGLRFWALKTVAGQDYGLVTYVEPAVTAIVASVFFKETFTNTTIIGVAIVFIGIWLAEVRIHRHGHFRSR
jgi:drug/metabolite transporter (DMT)-like permease